MKITLLKVDKEPLTLMGECAGICYGTLNRLAFPRIAKSCLESGHGRVSEFPDVIIRIEGLSARVGRELLRHCVGTTFLQASTRYIDYDNFGYVTPPTMRTHFSEFEYADVIYDNTMTYLTEAYRKLIELGVPQEDSAMILPLAMESTIVAKINLRALIHMFNVRSCTCAYHEYRNLMALIKSELEKVDDEWAFIARNYFIPKCEIAGFCNEYRTPCGRKPVYKRELS